MIENIEAFYYELLDKNNQYLSRLWCVEGATVTYQSLTALKQKANVRVLLDNHEILDKNNRIRVYYALNGEKTPIGTFLISTPKEIRNARYKTMEITCYSTLWLLQANKATKRHYLAEFTNVINEVRRMCSGYGVLIIMEESEKTTSIGREWEIGTPILDIINDLLESINYTSLHVDAQGNFISKPYLLPEKRIPTIFYDEGDRENIVIPVIENELDFFDVPNVFVRYVNNPDTPNLTAVYKNEKVSSPTSIVNAPVNVSSEELQDVADMETLIEIAKRDCANATNVYNKIEFQTAINPAHGYSHCISVNLNGIAGNYIETSWEIKCSVGSEMRHSARKIVTV